MISFFSVEVTFNIFKKNLLKWPLIHSKIYSNTRIDGSFILFFHINTKSRIIQKNSAFRDFFQNFVIFGLISADQGKHCCWFIRGVWKIIFIVTFEYWFLLLFNWTSYDIRHNRRTSYVSYLWCLYTYSHSFPSLRRFYKVLLLKKIVCHNLD